jgi:hypothetical protein
MFLQKTVLDYKIQDLEWLSEREREREEGKREEREKRAKKGKKKRGKERHLPFGNGCGSGAH